jgi:hypothetical protein
MRCPYCASDDQRVAHVSPPIGRLPLLRHVECRACRRWWTQTTAWPAESARRPAAQRPLTVRMRCAIGGRAALRSGERMSDGVGKGVCMVCWRLKEGRLAFVRAEPASPRFVCVDCAKAASRGAPARA